LGPSLYGWLDGTNAAGWLPEVNHLPFRELAGGFDQCSFDLILWQILAFPNRITPGQWLARVILAGRSEKDRELPMAGKTTDERNFCAH
jgi:hypothetical protein